MIKDWFYDKLKQDIGNKRFEHSLRVMEESKKLAKRYNASVEKAAVAGLLHDCGKFPKGINLLQLCNDFGIILDDITKNSPELIHSVLGTEMAKEQYGIEDEDILNAIRYHSTGRENMSLLEKIVYIADVTEPGRSFKGVNELRKLALKNLDEALIFSINNTIKLVMERDKLIHIDSIRARNQILMKKNMEW